MKMKQRNRREPPPELAALKASYDETMATISDMRSMMSRMRSHLDELVELAQRMAEEIASIEAEQELLHFTAFGHRLCRLDRPMASVPDLDITMSAQRNDKAGRWNIIASDGSLIEDGFFSRGAALRSSALTAT
jgi:hypothetical protein